MNILTRIPRHILVVALLSSCIGCDQATKQLATTELRSTGVHSFLGDTFRLVYTENPGAFLGMGGNLGKAAQLWILTIGVGAFLVVAVAYLILQGRSLGRLFVTALTLLIAGGFGNWFDRLVNHGRVVDFMNLGIGPVRTGIFNVADLAIVAGAVLFLFVPKTKGHPAA